MKRSTFKSTCSDVHTIKNKQCNHTQFFIHIVMNWHSWSKRKWCILHAHTHTHALTHTRMHTYMHTHAYTHLLYIYIVSSAELQQYSFRALDVACSCNSVGERMVMHCLLLKCSVCSMATTEKHNTRFSLKCDKKEFLFLRGIVHEWLCTSQKQSCMHK